MGEHRINRPVNVSPELLSLAKYILAEVESGRATSLGAVLVSAQGQINSPVMGAQATELYLGADIIKKVIMEAATKPAPILTPGHP